MRPLLEREFPAGSLEADAVELLRASQPHGMALGAKQRVRARLLAAPIRRARSTPRTLAAAAGLAAFALAAAAIAVPFWYRAPQAVQSTSSASSVAPRASDIPAPSAVPSPSDSPDAPGGEAPSAQPPASGEPGATGTASAHSSASAPAAALAVTETSLIYSAVRALRHNGDPGRASRLLDDYFRRFPNGALREEALALSVEVAAARGDASKKRELAKRYLEAYPNGHFRATAERVSAQGGK